MKLKYKIRYEVVNPYRIDLIKRVFDTKEEAIAFILSGKKSYATDKEPDKETAPDHYSIVERYYHA